jgi:hypothetical protein
MKYCLDLTVQGNKNVFGPCRENHILLFEAPGSYATSTLSSTEKEQRNPNFQYLPDCRVSPKHGNHIRFAKYFKLKI